MRVKRHWEPGAQFGLSAQYHEGKIKRFYLFELKDYDSQREFEAELVGYNLKNDEIKRRGKYEKIYGNAFAWLAQVNNRLEIVKFEKRGLIEKIIAKIKYFNGEFITKYYRWNLTKLHFTDKFEAIRWDRQTTPPEIKHPAESEVRDILENENERHLRLKFEAMK